MPFRSTIRDVLLLTVLAAGSGCAPLPGGGEKGRQITRTAATGNQAAVHTITGAASCAASGCHGQPYDGQRRNWQTAYSIWLHEDPHRRAFEVLYAERSVEMYRNMHPEARLQAKPPADEPYFQFLQARCIGCHATGRKGDAAVASPDAARRPDDLLAGVGCESCHGPASGWLDGHYLTIWPAPGDTQRESLAETGFRDTANLRTRASVCVGCHVGPQVAQDRLYDVNHDLIAAGHPRLAFEFEAYLENYPKHWAAEADELRHRQVYHGSLHIDAWRFGQEQAAIQSLRQIGLRLAASEKSAGSTWPDFSNFQCRDCHHALSPTAAGGQGVPRPALAALDNLLALRRMSGANQPAAIDELRLRLSDWHARQISVSDLAAVQRRLETDPLPPWPAINRGGYAGQLIALLDEFQTLGGNSEIAPPPPRPISFEQAVQLYLAVQALVRDLPDAAWQRGKLADANEQLRTALASEANFGQTAKGSVITQYDFPLSFNPASIADELAGVRQALEPVQSAFRPASAP